MKTEHGVPPKKEFFIGVFLTLAAVFILNLFITEEKDYSFRLMFSGFNENEIQKVVINIKDTTFDFSNPKFDYRPLNKPTLKFLVPNETGAMNLTVVTKNGAKYFLSNVEYKAGKSNYITKRETDIIYVKAHWQ